MSHECEMCECETFRFMGTLGCRNYYNCIACGWEVGFLVEEDPITPYDDRGDDEDGEEYEYDDDGQPDEAQEWHDFDPDC